MYRDVPGTDPDLLPAVRKVLKTFSVISYGDFDDFDELWNVTELPKLNHLNLTQLLLKVNNTTLLYTFSKSCSNCICTVLCTCVVVVHIILMRR